ncbi:MAG: DUF4062 domain-containing protein [Enterobacter asburiae]|uniref:DUF4062 domain-containing protein n=2 Tax=Enterobacter asburiae TaxID=61645 RepID=UPI001F0B8512|nr:DUF4062 domain-containing protein [Enterobacter asburiae]MCH4303680.1 DUF4062 domain-containing protein [Enterobacter asburiae]MDU6226235.1 DUF4062 domain-containing protein [Enterobacter asburiae]HDR2351946.1 DUF4062 domain-containing protein [Enterobacter asburiae]HDR2370961.1 DUF4062 domain-containing protein [Enterobacter asburiae]
MSRPTFFISSTIYDFRDLRSALKYCLEEQGVIVLASEFNDFQKPLDQHSYDACLTAMEKADYFVLLIGSRVGGWYDEVNKISITQQEYRQAYELHKQGKMKILSFVRSEVWQYREQRNELKRLLKEEAVDPALSQRLFNAPSKFASDAEALASFLTEVGRNAETKKALENGAPLPTGNWIHTFSNFRDIWDVVQSQVLTGLPVDNLAFRKLLARELIEILKSGLVKFKEDVVHSPIETVRSFHREHRLTFEGCNNERSVIISKYWKRISMFGFHLLSAQFQTQIVDRALETSYFLYFDHHVNAFVETPIYEALFKLQIEMRSLKRANTADVLSVILDNSPVRRGDTGDTIDIETIKLVPFLHLMDRWTNIVLLSQAIFKHLDGEEFVMPPLRPRSPIADMNEMIAAESPSDEDVFEFLEL